MLYWSVSVVRSEDGDFHSNEDKIIAWNFPLSILFIFSRVNNGILNLWFGMCQFKKYRLVIRYKRGRTSVTTVLSLSEITRFNV